MFLTKFYVRNYDSSFKISQYFPPAQLIIPMRFSVYKTSWDYELVLYNIYEELFFCKISKFLFTSVIGIESTQVRLGASIDNWNGMPPQRCARKISREEKLQVLKTTRTNINY